MGAIEPAAQHTAAGYAKLKDINTNYCFSKTDINILRNLALQVKDISSWDSMAEKALLWKNHNELKSDIPTVFIDPENGWNELIPVSSLECTDPLARVWEMVMRKSIYWAVELKDDRVIDDFFDVPYSYTDCTYGVEQHIEESDSPGGAYHIDTVIGDYEQDFGKLNYTQIIIDEKESAIVMDLAQEIFSGILNVRRKNTWWWTLGMCWDYISLRGLEDFMCDMVIDPEWVHRMFAFLCESKLKMLDYLEQGGFLAPNNDNTYVGSGGFGFTDELTPVKDHVQTKDMWGFCDAQETAQVDPDMYGEFVLPYHKKILSRFGLSYYGCCEGFNNRWKYVKELPNLRRVSVSPWADWSCVPEYLGREYVACVKPNPTPLAFGDMDESVVRRDCANAVKQTKGGICEFIMKDNNTLGNNPYNAKRWVEIMREEIEKGY